MSPLVIRAIERTKLHTNARLKHQREKRYSLFFFSFYKGEGIGRDVINLRYLSSNKLPRIASLNAGKRKQHIHTRTP